MITPRYPRLELEDVEDVVVVQFTDRKILDEQNIQVIGEELFGLVDEGRRKKVLLDFTTVEFLSSAALGKVITLGKKTMTLGGRLAMCGLIPEISEVFEITKLDKFFRIFKTREEALAAVAGPPGNTVTLGCPTPECTGSATARADLVGAEVHLRCPECDAKYSVGLPEVPAEGAAAAPVSFLRLDTYEGERLRVKPGPLTVLWVEGRLDLFAADSLGKLWRLLPAPRRILVDCRRLFKPTAAGVENLVRLASDGRTGESRSVLLVRPPKPPPPPNPTPDPATKPSPPPEPELAELINGRVPTFTDWQEAVDALGQLPPGTWRPMSVTVRRTT